MSLGMKLVGVGGNAPPPWTSKDQALLLCKTPRLKLVADHIVFQFCILVPATYDFACTCCVHTSPSPRNFQPSLLSMWLIGLLQPILHPHIYIGLEIRAGFDFPGSPAFSPTEDPRGAFDVSRSASNCRMAIHAVGYAAPWVCCPPSSAQHVLGTCIWRL